MWGTCLKLCFTNYVPRYTIDLVDDTGLEKDEPILVLLDQLSSHGFLEREKDDHRSKSYNLTETGQKFRKRLLLTGDREYRLKHLWADDPEQEPEDQTTGSA